VPRDVPFTGKGGSPLAESKASWRPPCPRCGGPARRETDTMDTFVVSSWYFFRYTSRDWRRSRSIRKRPATGCRSIIHRRRRARRCSIFSTPRFFTKALRDVGLTAIAEPFTNLLTQGMVSKETYRCEEHEWLFPNELVGSEAEGWCCPRCGRPVIKGRVEKMSKSKKNIVDPEDLIAQYGADTARLFTLFAAPPEKDLEWNAQGVEGCFPLSDASLALHRTKQRSARPRRLSARRASTRRQGA
jgi:leucyl-tRNA synthetase